MLTGRWVLIVVGLPLLYFSGGAVLLGGEDTPAATRATMGVWDTGAASAELLSPEALAARNGWTPIPADQNAPSFKGDAVITNGRLWAVLRKQSAAAEVYAANAGGAAFRLRVLPLATGGQPAARQERLALAANTKAGVSLEAAFKTANGADIALKFRVGRDMAALEADPGPGAGSLRIECPSEFVVLPDFFADDIVINPRKMPLPQTEVPSENFVLHLTGNRNAIAMCVFENREQDAKLFLTGEGDKRMISGSEISFGEPGKQTANPKAPAGRKIWVALLEAPRIWHTFELQAADAEKIRPLDWKMPMAACWRVDLSLANGLVDSWDMLLQQKQGGQYIKPGWLGGGEGTLPADRKRWLTVLGSFPYPCFSDPDGQGFVQPLKKEKLAIQGPLVVYPINRVKQTPLDPCTVADVMRSALGVGACEYILDVENQQSHNVGRATCSTRDTLVPIYTKGEQKQKRAVVDKTIDEALAFVRFIRSRITGYVDFGHKIREYLAEQKKAHPELAEPIAELDNLAQETDRRFAARQRTIKTPDDVAAMNADFRKNVLDDTGPDALAKCKKYAFALVEIGGSQDELAGECRWAVKALRQRAGILVALDPRVALVANEIRSRTQEVLRNPAGHEGARH